MVHRSAASLRLSVPSLSALGVVALLALSCDRDSRNIRSAAHSKAQNPTRLSTESFPLCTLIGPATHSPGIFGTDLGFTVRDPSDSSRLAILFGDTWARAGGACQYPVLGSDDLQAWLPAERPSVLQAGNPSAESGSACQTLGYAHTDKNDPTSWPRIRLFDGSTVMDTGALHTPVTAFTDGKRLFAIYSRDDAAYCKGSRECPDGMTCSADPAYRGKKLGACAHTSAGSGGGEPTYCRDVTDCSAGLDCGNADRGVCLATSAFEMRSPRGFVAPSWYRDDPRLGIAHTLYLAARTSPAGGTDYAVVKRFVTNRFVNVAARTIANFDEAHPEKNDYRQGTQTLLLWGRSAFFGMGGVQNLPFLLHVSLADLEKGSERWEPRFFAGYDHAGAPAWSNKESDAEPVYGTDARLSPTGEIQWFEPEFDYDNQMTVSFIPALGRFVMLYGGDVPAFMVRDPRTGATPDPTFPQRSPGAIHLRTAPHPWGRLRQDPLANEGFSSPEPVLTRAAAAQFLACGKGGEAEMPGCLKGAQISPGDPTPAPLSAAATCAFGDLAMSAQAEMSGNPIGRFYAPNIIDEWTEDVTNRASGLVPGEHEVEIYWNVSTWNPYQVILAKTRLRGQAAH